MRKLVQIHIFEVSTFTQQLLSDNENNKGRTSSDKGQMKSLTRNDLDSLNLNDPKTLSDLAKKL